MPESDVQNSPTPGRFLIAAMAAACAVAVANLYYIQPLLAEMAAAFHTSQLQMGAAATLTQAGYALGMLFLLPLADIREKKSMIVFMLLCAAGSLMLMAVSQNSAALCAVSFVVGFSSISPQLLVPLAAQLTAPKMRGRVIGSVMSGLLIGILLSRTFSGLVGRYFGWRCVYAAAAAVTLALAGFLWAVLPKCPPLVQMRYADLFRTMPPLVRRFPALREAAFNGAMMFGAFSIFWSTLSYLLAGPQYRLGPDAAGLFGLVGVVGASAAPVAGRIADRRSPRLTIAVCMGVNAAAFLCFLFFGSRIAGLIAGVVLLDLGVQAGQISNQARVHAISDEARNRINTVYMVTYFAGGALGTLSGTLCYTHFGWPGVCAAGLVTQALAAAYHTVSGIRHPARTAETDR